MRRDRTGQLQRRFRPGRAQATEAASRLFDQQGRASTRRWTGMVQATGRAAGVSALVWKDGREVYFGKSGHADRENGMPMAARHDRADLLDDQAGYRGRADAIVGAGPKFGLDDPVARYLPEFANMQVYAGKDVERCRAISPGGPPDQHPGPDAAQRRALRVRARKRPRMKRSASPSRRRSTTTWPNWAAVWRACRFAARSRRTLGLRHFGGRAGAAGREAVGPALCRLCEAAHPCSAQDARHGVAAAGCQSCALRCACIKRRDGKLERDGRRRKPAR
jgi:hypothetical protein